MYTKYYKLYKVSRSIRLNSANYEISCRGTV